MPCPGGILTVLTKRGPAELSAGCYSPLRIVRSYLKACALSRAIGANPDQPEPQTGTQKILGKA
jgi:hypothetical protein